MGPTNPSIGIGTVDRFKEEQQKREERQAEMREQTTAFFPKLKIIHDFDELRDVTIKETLDHELRGDDDGGYLTAWFLTTDGILMLDTEGAGHGASFGYNTGIYVHNKAGKTCLYWDGFYQSYGSYDEKKLQVWIDKGIAMYGLMIFIKSIEPKVKQEQAKKELESLERQILEQEKRKTELQKKYEEVRMKT